jgi:uncharacterized membrane protein
MSAVTRNWRWLLATLLLAAAVHVISVAYLPGFIMGRTMAGAARLSGGVNRMYFSARPTAASRGVVRPSPDLLYAACVFDVSNGPVRVHGSGMPQTYWSVSLFDDDTDNFFVLNDRQAKDGSFDFTIVPLNTEKLPPGKVVRARSLRGLVLLRVLIDDDARLPAIDKARRHVACGAV